jgi:hypothetical protein
MKNLQATSSISYRKQTRRRHELIDIKGGRGKKDEIGAGLQTDIFHPVFDETATANKGVYASSPEYATKLTILCR